MRVAIQGETASFHHQAASEWFGPDVTIVPADTFLGTFEAVKRGAADCVIVAIENSLYGSINQVYDLIEGYAYPIVGEIHLPIHHQLIGTPESDITHIYSHPVALAQCEQFLETHYQHAKRVEFHDTAAAVEHIKQLHDPHAAAIASRSAAELHGMDIIATNIEDNPANFTRFLVLQPGGSVPEQADRSSIVITTNHTPGALAKVLTLLAERTINLAKLQSRPIIGQPWHYKFYLVLDAAGPELHAALDDLTPLVESLTILGEYQHAKTQ